MNSSWSDELVALTRESIDQMLTSTMTPAAPLCMKHREDRFGILVAEPNTQKPLVIIDREDGRREAFDSIDTVIK